jgi:glutamate synthase domain-containing protein 3
MQRVSIDAAGIHYTDLNKEIKRAVAAGAGEITLTNVLGQRFIADGLRGDVSLIIRGVPGGDLGMFMSGPTCTVYGNSDHASGNTMDAGTIIIHGSSGDAVAHSMRGGSIYVRDNVGYRAGIHMKQYEEKCPVLVIGGSARAFLGEYMAGGLIILLRRGEVGPFSERGIGSGIHGGEIVVRGEISPECLGVGAKVAPASSEDIGRIKPYLERYRAFFGEDSALQPDAPYTRVTPSSSRPFANKYVWE